MKRSTRWIGAVAAAIVSIPSVFFVSWMYLHAMVEEQYRTGVRVSTDGDSIIIPVVGVTFARIALLLTVSAVTGVVLLVRSWLRRRAT